MPTDTLSKKIRTLLLVSCLFVGMSFTWPASAEENGNSQEPMEKSDVQTEPKKETESESRITDEYIPLQKIPDRPQLAVEWGEPFLGPGPLGEEYELPTGAVWRPAFWVYGQYRTAVQTFNDGVNPQSSQWANRLDIFGNLKLSGTERILIGFRPFDSNGKFASWNWQPEGGFNDDVFNAVVRTLFFEGDLGEMFPNLDPDDSQAFDIGFTVGRQGFIFQEGILLNTGAGLDFNSGGAGNPDSVGISRNNLQLPWIPNLRVTGVYGWNNIYRGNNELDREAKIVGLFSEADYPHGLMDLDVVYLTSGKTGDAMFAGFRAVQRIGRFNTTFLVNTSQPFERQTPETNRGTLLVTQVSVTPHRTDNIAYLDAFWGIGKFSSAIRGPVTGGPLGRLGILFQAVGLGTYGAALGNQPDNSVGGSVGYQMFLDGIRRQAILEVGGRTDTNDTDDITFKSAGAIGLRLLQAIGQHYYLRFDGFGALQEDRNTGYGGRIELFAVF